jgi:hypothetical protein
MMCLHCTHLDFKGAGAKDHRDMLRLGFGPCTGTPGPSRTDGGHMTKWMGLDKDRQCEQFDLAAEDAIAARAAWREKQKAKREAA